MAIKAATPIVIIKGIVASLVAAPKSIRMEQTTSAKAASAKEVNMPIPKGSAN